jgi:autotransporter passenger strand-loop-strand repeat protein
MTTITVSSGQTWNVSSGETDNGDIVLGGGFIYVTSGGTTIDTTVSSGGNETVYAGSTTSGTVVLGGGEQVCR